MIDSIAFRTRARTIDHLGREQIADCPTAVSELWKNAYDAYARKVALNIYSGETPIASVVDDGHGMSRDEFESKWLVIGTESKIFGYSDQQTDRNGLSSRVKQGQKGIGRLSSAYLGSLLLIISKRSSSNFVASLIDWRIFENPFLYLQDVEIPIAEFAQAEELWLELPRLFDKLMGNVWGDGKDVGRDARVTKAWELYDEIELKEKKSSTKKAIETSLLETTFSERHIENWDVWKGESLSGTAMVMAHIAYDLEAQLKGFYDNLGADAASQARDRLVQTLVNFTDPFAHGEHSTSDAAALNFEYSVTAWDGGLARTVISKNNSFTYENLEDLEHIIDGNIDDNGRFVGRVKAFGEWLTEPAIIPPMSPMTAKVVGSFDLVIGTFEQLQRTTMDQAIHSQVTAQVEKYGGFLVFRNGLRVMPYGRVDNDFFEIEQRRSEHAGREFWSNRRMFGRIALSRQNNPNLRDKSGREGLIDNKSAKIFRDLVTNILRTTARRYFGTGSDLRLQLLPAIEEQIKRKHAEESQKKVKTRKRKEFKSNLEKYLPKVNSIQHELADIAKLAQEDALPTDLEGLMQIRKRVSDLKTERASLSLGLAPQNLGSLEGKFAEFKKANNNSGSMLLEVANSVSYALQKINPSSPREIAYSELNRNAAKIHSRVRRWNATIREIYSTETSRIAQLIDDRQKSYHKKMLPLLEDLEEEKIDLSSLLNQLDTEWEKEDVANFSLFEAYISSLRNLQDSIDLDLLVSTSMEEAESTRAEIDRLNSLAQLGITVEIVGHEMEGLESTISAGLDNLPYAIKKTEEFKSIRTAHHSLVDKLRFLSPMKLSGERVKRWIRGQEIFDYSESFLNRTLDSKNITLQASEDFLQFSVFEQASRLYPVFINLINNAAYWCDHSPALPKLIKLNVSGQKIIVSDTGPGVDEQDLKHLFTLFFTKKIRGGRGVGLYLARANLAAGGHIISYITEPSKKLLQGANFAIEFRGARYE